MELEKIFKGQKMLTTRYKTDNTSKNLSALVNLINDPGCQRVTLFASPEESESGCSDSSHRFVTALAEMDIHGIDQVGIVFDGIFLTAASAARYYEVRQLLDVAQASNKVFFGEERVPFTSAMDPADAANELGKLASRGSQKLTPDTRANYFSLLTTWPENRDI
jgi:hypothetical protein